MVKVGDLVQLSAYGKRKSFIAIRNPKYGIIVCIEDDQLLMNNGDLKDIVSYRVRWLDQQGNPIETTTGGTIGTQRIMLKFLNKNKTSIV
jgi:hypothetical protein